MIVVTGTIDVHPEDVWPATTIAAEMVRRTEQEEGCISYRFYVDINQLTRFRLYEEWRSKEDLALHMETPHMEAFLARIADLRIIDRTVVRYEVTDAQPV
ncbi:MAG: putative quinol monooxygenase [Pikeienuella sp.]